MKNITSPAYGDWIRSRIDSQTTKLLKDYDASYDSGNQGGTTHMVAFGPDGSAVSLTSTINHQ